MAEVNLASNADLDEFDERLDRRDIDADIDVGVFRFGLWTLTGETWLVEVHSRTAKKQASNRQMGKWTITLTIAVYPIGKCAF